MTINASLNRTANTPGHPRFGYGMIRMLSSVVATPVVTALIGVAEGLAELLLLYFVGTSVRALVGLG